MNTSEAIAVLTKVVEERGFTHICPEALTDLKDQVDLWGWSQVSREVEGPQVRQAYQIVMDGFRALFAPAH